MYTALLRDVTFPQAFSSLVGTLVQNGAVLVPSIASGGTDAALATGDASVLVFAIPPASGNSLFAVSLTPATGGTPLLARTQGVGPLIGTREVDVITAGSYDVTVSDLQFPQAFQDLYVAVTTGIDMVGQVFGGGTFTLSAPAGKLFVSVLGRPATGADYATWGFELATPPPAPTLSLVADPTQVASGAASTLTWSAIDATSCAASGAWTGSRATAGSAGTGALLAASTFTLSCTGPGGSQMQSVTVNIAAPDSGDGGGGSLDALLLVAMAAMLAARATSRRRPSIT
jgi:hypothetical protein